MGLGDAWTRRLRPILTRLGLPASSWLRAQGRALTLSQRIAWLTGIAVALAVLVTGTAAFATVRVTVYYQLDHELVDIASQADQSVTSSEQIRSQIDASGLHTAGLVVAVVDAKGTIDYTSDPSDSLVLDTTEMATARLGAGYSARTGQTARGESYRIVAVPMTNLPQHALVVGRPLQLTNWVLSSLLVVLLSFGAVAAILSGVIGAAVARQSLRPVRQLTRAVEYVAVTDDLTAIDVVGTDELARLARSFNTMLGSLSSARERQKQLIADAGHELRTPLTSLRTNIELLSADAKNPFLPEGARQDILADVSAQLTEFTNLVHDLVQLARDDRVQPQLEPLDLRDVVEDAIAKARLRGPHLRWDVELNSVLVMGEYDTLVRAVTNLLDNAVKWSPPDGTIRVQLEGDRLRVADEGPGIADEDPPYIFDRFYRSDTARNTPGTGLGLSIVAQTVARHGGWVRAGRSAQGGAEFTIRLPLAGSDESEPDDDPE